MNFLATMQNSATKFSGYLQILLHYIFILNNPAVLSLPFVEVYYAVSKKSFKSVQTQFAFLFATFHFNFQEHSINLRRETFQNLG